MTLYLIIGYLLGVGIFATADFLRYEGRVGLLRCILLALSFPIHLLNVALALFYSFFGILYLPLVKYVSYSPEGLEETLKNQVKELEKISEVTKDDNTPLQ